MMEIRKIKAQAVTETVRRLFMDCNYYIGEDIERALRQAEERESSPVGREVLAQLLENNRIYQEIYEAQTKGGGDFDQPAPAEEGKEGEIA